MTRYLIISSFLNFLAAGMLGFAVVVRGRKDSINTRFGVFALFIGGWSAGYLLWQIAGDSSRALFFSRLLMFFAYFMSPAFLHFVVELCGETRRWVVRVGYVFASIFALLNFTPLMVARVAPVKNFAFWPVAGPVYWAYLLNFAILFLYACWILWKNLRLATGGRAIQLRYILASSLMGFGGGATNFPLWYGFPLPPFGNLLIFIYLLMIAYAVSRYQLPLVTHDFMLAVVYVGFSITLAVFYLLGLAFAAPFIGYQLNSESLLNNFLVCILISLFFTWAVPRITRSANGIMSQTYMRRRNTQQLQLKKLGQRIVSLGSEQEIFENSVREVALAFNLGAAAVYSRTEFDQDYQLRAVNGWQHCPTVLPVDTGLTRVLQHRMGHLLFDGSEIEMAAAALPELDSLRAKIPAEAVFSIASDDFLSGILFLGARTDGERYTEAELALIESTCLQIAVTLRARQLERRASQTEKLISLGTLAAGLAHELRNPLTSIQTFSALLREEDPDPEVLQEFSGVVQRDVNRIASIVENVAAFAESNKVEMTAAQLSDVLRTVAEIVHPELVRTGIVIDLPTTAVPDVLGNYSQLLQVFLNLTQNAIQALEGTPNGRITFGLETRVEDVPEPLLLISVSDNGPGIDPGVLPRIFEPFTTTKATGQRLGKHGMGLGLAIVKRIVQHHHGDIHVDSAVGQGTTFRVHLPLID